MNPHGSTKSRCILVIKSVCHRLKWLRHRYQLPETEEVMARHVYQGVNDGNRSHGQGAAAAKGRVDEEGDESVVQAKHWGQPTIQAGIAQAVGHYHGRDGDAGHQIILHTM